MNPFKTAIVAGSLFLLGSCDNTKPCDNTKQSIIRQDTKDSLFITVNTKQQAIQMKTQQEYYDKIDMAFRGYFINLDLGPEDFLLEIEKNNDRESAIYLKKYLHLTRRKHEILSTMVSITRDLSDSSKAEELLNDFGDELDRNQKAQLHSILSERNLSAGK